MAIYYYYYCNHHHQQQHQQQQQQQQPHPNDAEKHDSNEDILTYRPVAGK